MSRLVFWTCAILLPCVPLFTGPPQSTDWVNNVWQIEYGADHLARTGLPPVVFNTVELGGIPYPIFYGYLIYPFLSALALVVGAGNALRLAVIGVNVLQFAIVRRAVKNGGGDEFLASIVACLTVWAIYPFTNVYNRGAVMEFLAGGLLTCAVCRWFALLDAETARQRLRAALEVGLLYTLAAGAHPITALYGLAFLALHALTGFALTRRDGRGSVAGRFLALVPAGALTVVVLAPWVYACAKLSDKFAIRAYGLHLFPDTIDCWWQRLLSLPHEAWRLFGVTDPQAAATTLDAQMNGPLVLVAGVVAWAAVRGLRDCRAWWLAVPGLLGLVSLGMSLRPELYEVLPSPFRMVQFPYRLVTYVNLSALAGVLLAVRLVAEGEAGGWTAVRRVERTALLLTALGVSVFSLGVKLRSAAHPCQAVAVEARHLPETFNGWADYTTPDLHTSVGGTQEEMARWGVHVRLELTTTGRPRYEPLRLKSPEAKFVVVQVQPFPWTVLELDGAPMSKEQVFVWHGPSEQHPNPNWILRPYLCVLVPPGEHILTHRFQPPKTWQRLTAVAFPTLLFWIGAVLAPCFRRRAVATEIPPA